jgi:UDP-N-acetylenolpyruvoylglucosamine reductase
LPPASEASRERTFAINVEGTSTILRAMAAGTTDAVLVFSSSVSTYGDTRAEPPPVGVAHPQRALDIYAESKIASEGRIRESSVDAVILRIAGISGNHAAKLIEASGLKGYRIGGAVVSDKHANFIINTGDATAADIESLISHIQKTVAAQHGISLLHEVRMVGEAHS